MKSVREPCCSRHVVCLDSRGVPAHQQPNETIANFMLLIDRPGRLLECSLSQMRQIEAGVEVYSEHTTRWKLDKWQENDMQTRHFTQNVCLPSNRFRWLPQSKQQSSDKVLLVFNVFRVHIHADSAARVYLFSSKHRVSIIEFHDSNREMSMTWHGLN